MSSVSLGIKTKQSMSQTCLSSCPPTLPLMLGPSKPIEFHVSCICVCVCVSVCVDCTIWEKSSSSLHVFISIFSQLPTPVACLIYAQPRPKIKLSLTYRHQMHIYVSLCTGCSWMCIYVYGHVNSLIAPNDDDNLQISATFDLHNWD